MEEWLVLLANRFRDMLGDKELLLWDLRLEMRKFLLNLSWNIFWRLAGDEVAWDEEWGGKAVWGEAGEQVHSLAGKGWLN